ncbi:uncharacterized protein TNIN_87831 [Trichonephila inaurata madagascariensis]|uniref:Peptidase aspartic putative domain-containing protein n=1 Tax=Trichonephila inaurata madagascariensis TaxID=2747483 RepID=A0A8X6YFT4_9ARAC|nr:uncharacterized protein TNIN_87831 [Trichonephila inaurata madagascariensis]
MCNCNSKSIDKPHLEINKSDTSNDTVLTNNSCSNEVLLQILIVCIKDKGLNYYVRAIFDSGSQKSYVSKFVAESLKLKCMGEIKHLHKGLVAVNTKLGWTVLGKVKNSNRYTKNTNVLLSLHVHNFDISTLWSLDTTDIRDVGGKELEDAAKEHFLLGEMRKADTYVNSVEECSKFISESQALVSTAKFNLRGWECSHKLSELNNSDEETKVVPVLGLNWNLPSDTLSIDVKYFSEEKGTPVTKRHVLSAVYRIFNPIGFPLITLTPKLLLKECWRMGISWDVELPLEMRIKFEKWKSRLPLLKEISIPRYLLKNSSSYAKVTMPIFCDASQSGYAACVFIRTEFKNNISCELVQAGNRASPIKITISPIRTVILYNWCQIK